MHTLASKTRIIILATRTQSVLGEKGRRIRELTSLVQKRFNFAEDKVEVSFVSVFYFPTLVVDICSFSCQPLDHPLS